MKISIASGKGGTGKTLVATSLVKALARSQPVQLLDCDVEEPNAHLFLAAEPVEEEIINLQVPRVDYNLCQYCGKCAEVCQFNAIALMKHALVIFPDVCHSCGGCWQLCPSAALAAVDREIGQVGVSQTGNLRVVSGKLKLGTHISPPLIKAVRKRADEAGINIIDGPPGSSCPVMAAVAGTDYCVLVTEPTPFGLNDLALAAEMVQVLGIPCGVVVNRDVPGNDIIDRFCRQKGLTILMRIPMQQDIARAYARGKTLVDMDPAWQREFVDLYRQIAQGVMK